MVRGSRLPAQLIDMLGFYTRLGLREGSLLPRQV